MNPAWLALVISLPTANTAARMRAWRALKALGCGVLRDGVYLLPNLPGLRQALQAQAEDVSASGGAAHVLVLDGETPAQEEAFRRLFDRSGEYAGLAEAIRQAALRLPEEEPARLPRQVARLRKDFEALAALDFFPGEARAQAAAALAALERSARQRLAPGEPLPSEASVECFSPADFQGRRWATRRRPWIDRLASAWLIRRFIDPQARFLWLDGPADCPPDAVGFDFDGAEFSHAGARVTFETLAASFGLADDPALARLGGLVHYLDVGGIPVAEAAGLEALARGMALRLADDDALLAEAEKVFDSFYLAFTGEIP